MVVELQADEGRRGGSPRLGLTPVARESSVCQIGRKVASADPAENSNKSKTTADIQDLLEFVHGKGQTCSEPQVSSRRVIVHLLFHAPRQILPILKDSTSITACGTSPASKPCTSSAAVSYLQSVSGRHPVVLSRIEDEIVHRSAQGRGE